MIYSGTQKPVTAGEYLYDDTPKEQSSETVSISEKDVYKRQDLLRLNLRLLQKAQNRLLQYLVRGVRSYHNHGRLLCHRYSASISRIPP